MTSVTTHHPTDELLNQYAQGLTSVSMSIALSAHLELCQTCREKVRNYEASAADEWAGQDYQGEDFSHMVDAIVQHSQSTSIKSSARMNEIHMLDRSVTIPEVLARAAGEGLVWKKLAGGINQARMQLDNETQCEFIYMKPGCQTPVHTHQGSEVTLVLHGGFNDEMGVYEVGDFVVRGPEHQHQPRSEDGCLCFTVLDSPLTFTQGLARLLNPFSRYRFKRSLAP